MSQRNLFVLLGVLVVLALAVVIAQRSRAPAANQGAAFVPALAPALNELDRVTLTKASNEIVATLERRESGWVVTEKGSYPADVAKLRQNLRALADAKILEEKTATPELYDRLGVVDAAAANATGIQVSAAAAGKPLPAVILGDAQGNKYRYARRAGEQQSYLLDRDPNFPRNTSQWLAPAIVDVKGERVQQITIKQPDGETVTISKPSATASNYEVAGVPKGRELLYPGVANVTGNALRELNLEDVEPAAGAPPAAQPVNVEFRTFDGLVLNVVGSKQDDSAWITVAAHYDTDQAARFAPPAAPAVDPNLPPEANPPAAEPAPGAAPTASAADVAAEAEQINRRTSGWRYKIAAFQYDQMTRRMSDLLKPPAG